MKLSQEQKCKNRIIKTAILIKFQKKDVIEGLRDIFELWTNAGFEENDIYNTLNLIDSETDQIIKGDIQKNFSKDFLEQQNKWEQEYLKSEKPFIDKLIEELSQIPIIEEEEETYL